MTEASTDRYMIAPGVRMLPNGRLVVVDADVERGFVEAVRRLRPFVRSRAKRLADDDRELERELAQEAWIKLWELDPLRLRDEDEPYVRTVLSNHMADLARGEHGRRRKRKVEKQPAKQPQPAAEPTQEVS